MDKTTPRKLYSNVLGFYTHTFFRIHILSNFTFHHMSSMDYSILSHEYIHFLQDISTSYGAFNAYAISEYIKSVADFIRNSPNGRIDVPFTPAITSDNVYANCHVRECVYGDYQKIDKITNIIQLNNCNERLESSELDSIPYVEIELNDEGGNRKIINFGACAVMESMAFLMERYIAPIKNDAPDFPYRIAELIVQWYYPEFGNNPLNILALCDCSLLSSSPGHTFISHIIQFKEDGWLPQNASEIYGKILDGGFQISGSYSGVRTYSEEMEEMQKLAINSLLSFFNTSMPRHRKWIEETINRGFSLRVGKPDFMLEIARGGDIMHNPVLKTLINDYIGTPVITNPRAEGTIKTPNVSLDSDFFIFSAVGEIFNLFYSGDCKCGMRDICTRLEGPVDEKCDTAPWTHDVEIERFCPYSLMWHNWAFKQCSPKNTILQNNVLPS